MVAALPRVKFGPLFYRCDNFKSHMLKQMEGNYFVCIKLPSEFRKDLQWWCDNITTTNNDIHKGPASETAECDAPNVAWGAYLVNKKVKQTTGGNWTAAEAEKRINYLELLAAWFYRLTFVVF